jgi:1-acyl-sn-glycerol-3-phosphate acyltransferase
LNDHVSIWMAPEGTRSYDGKIGPLKKGGFHLALDAGVPIVPVAIRGTMDAFKRGTKSMKKGQRVEITIGAPIDVAGRDLESLIAEVTTFLKAHVER